MTISNETKTATSQGIPLVINTKVSSKSCESSVQVRYRRQSVARNILTNHGHTKHRIALCKRYLRSGATNAELNFSLKHGSASYKNLISCGSVWVCPVCASKVTEHRRSDLLTAISSQDNYYYYLVTFTLGHKKYDFLKVLLDRLTKAIKTTKSGCRWQKFREEIGYIGTISTLEITYNPKHNGWHPHYHMLLITDKNASERNIKDYFSNIYLATMAKLGGYATEEVGVNVQYAKEKEEAVGYVLKWGVTEELTRSHVKKAGGGGYSAFELLDLAEGGEVWAIQAFKEYSEATKGKKLLSFSKGLKQLLGLDNKTDEQIAEEEEQEADNINLAKFDDQDLIIIREHNLQGLILHLANNKEFNNLGTLFIDYGIGWVNKQFFDTGERVT